MAKAPFGRKLAVAGRILRSAAGHSRNLRGLGHGARAAWNSLSRLLRQLWHEVTGFLFLCFAAAGAFAVLREYRLDHAPGRPSRLAVALCFTAVFAWFGVTSFLRARKVGGRQ